MKKKNIFAVVTILAVLIIAITGINQLLPKKVEGAKEIQVVIRDDMANKELYKGSLNTDATTLYEFLVEKEELKVVLEKSTYGNFVVSIMDVKQGDIATGPWWLYESDNNESCTTAGMCPGIDTLALQDGDIFLFKLTNAFE